MNIEELIRGSKTWISTRERLPEDGQEVRVCGSGSFSNSRLATFVKKGAHGEPCWRIYHWDYMKPNWTNYPLDWFGDSVYWMPDAMPREFKGE